MKRISRNLRFGDFRLHLRKAETLFQAKRILARRPTLVGSATHSFNAYLVLFSLCLVVFVFKYVGLLFVCRTTVLECFLTKVVAAETK